MLGLLLSALKAAGKDVLSGVENNIRGGHQQPQQAQPYTPPATPAAAASPMDLGPVAAPPRANLPTMTNMPQLPQPGMAPADPNKRRLGAMDVY